MTDTARLLAASAAGYAIGNFPSADLAARVAGADLRSEGTNNPGAMNASHVLGKKWGLAVTAMDIGKGALAARVGGRLAGPAGANLASSAAVSGHCFPIGRTGGKGVAASIGQVVGTFPSYLPVDIAVAASTSALPFFRQRTRVATMVASATWIGCSVVWWRRGLANPGGVIPTISLPLAAFISSVVIAVRFAAEADKVDAFNDTSVVDIAAAA
ncbi:MAG: glycerol-3-phosphate acyltransferase PlsY [Candidatus Aldehydirespiratoraceae bacterium]|jgi:glycerol-3-phosphate acyltransferase PlsY